MSCVERHGSRKSISKGSDSLLSKLPSFATIFRLNGEVSTKLRSYAFTLTEGKVPPSSRTKTSEPTKGELTTSSYSIVPQSAMSGVARVKKYSTSSKMDC